MAGTKDELPFLGFLTPKREHVSISTPIIARRSVRICEDVDVTTFNQDNRDGSSAIVTVVVEPGTPDSSRFANTLRTPDSGDHWSSNSVRQPYTAPQRHSSGGDNEQPGFETPGRKLHPGRTYLQDRMFGDLFDSPGRTSATTDPVGAPGSDFLSPDRDWGKRGRPRADEINSLIMEGSQSGSNIKCHICSRVFPREKSLQAHLRTHTGERPYTCDYPACSRAFTQSGQLKTHQRLHAGEKPFVCSAAGCENRYTHANRQCPDHPFAKPQRTAEIILQPNIAANEDRDMVIQWLQKYRREREEKTPGKPNHQQLPNDENSDLLASDPSPPPTAFSLATKNLKSKRGLMKEMDQTIGQENMVRVAVSAGAQQEQRPLPMLLTAHESFNQALRRAGERLERAIGAAPSRQQQQSLYPALKDVGNSPEHAAMLSGVTLASTAAVTNSANCSPAKRRPLFSTAAACDLVSPLKSIRRTLGDITPTKNCRADMISELELPFNFGILQTSPPDQLTNTAGSRNLMLPPTPSSSEKSPYYPSSGVGGSLFGSPALKLKKRFQERFQEERLISGEPNGSGSTGADYFANPIAWTEEDDEVSELSSKNSSQNRVRWSGSRLMAANDSIIADSLLSPPRTSAGTTGRDGSPTFLVATALVELYESPSRQQGSGNSQEIPLNLTKRSYS